jgi:hypothetical protein
MVVTMVIKSESKRTGKRYKIERGGKGKHEKE